MRSKSRSTKSRVPAKTRTKQRGSTTTIVLIIALLAAAAAVGFLLMQTSKFQNGRSDGLALEPPAQGDETVQMSLSPTAARKKGLLENIFGKKEEAVQPEQVLPPTTPTPTLFIRPIQAGLLEFSISQGSEMTGPLFVKGAVSDFATARDVTQTVKIYFDKQRPAQSVTAKLLTDTKQTPITMSKQADEAGYEVWKGEWMLQDTNNSNMAINFEATNQQGTSIAGVAAR